MQLSRPASHVRPIVLGIVLGVTAWCTTPTAGAQGSQTDDHAGVLIQGRDLAMFGGATAATIALAPFDTRIARMFSDSGFHARHPGLETAAKRGSVVTETVLMGAGATVWGIARLRHDAGTADVAFHTAESVASAAMFIQVIRGALGRARPYVIDDVGEKKDADPFDFELLHGFTSFNYRSFPSMHAMASFAAATALTQEMRWRGTRHRAVIAPLLYTAATIPPVARMYLDEHWASDIAMGIFLGIFAGQKVVGYSHAHPDNRVDREFLKPDLRAGISWDARGASLFVSPF